MPRGTPATRPEAPLGLPALRVGGPSQSRGRRRRARQPTGACGQSTGAAVRPGEPAGAPRGPAVDVFSVPLHHQEHNARMPDVRTLLS